jgi:hypothetical protein
LQIEHLSNPTPFSAQWAHVSRRGAISENSCVPLIGSHSPVPLIGSHSPVPLIGSPSPDLMFVLGAVCSFLEPFLVHLSPNIDNVLKN